MTHEEAWKPIDSAVWEMGEALDGLSDADLWVRAHPRLLSIGELMAHVGHGLLRWLHPSLESPFAVEGVGYYTTSVNEPMNAGWPVAEAYRELKRIAAECKEEFLRRQPALADKLPGRDDWTWGYAVEYSAFHIAYHTGQMYSVRHLMGHETVDN